MPNLQRNSDEHPKENSTTSVVVTKDRILSSTRSMHQARDGLSFSN